MNEQECCFDQCDFQAVNERRIKMGNPDKKGSLVKGNVAYTLKGSVLKVERVSGTNTSKIKIALADTFEEFVVLNSDKFKQDMNVTLSIDIKGVKQGFKRSL